MTNTVDSVWKKVDRRGDDECWPWIGKTKSDNGYGRLDVNGMEGVYAHRVAYLSANPGSIELRFIDECVLHHCDNPKCCNPKHLFLGTHQDNMDDKARKGRVGSHKGVAAHRAKLTSEEVFFIRLQKKAGATINALALLYSVSRATISGLLYGRYYTDVP